VTQEEQDIARETTREELRQVEKDLRAFSEARGVIQRRINEMDKTPRQEMFVSWAATQVIFNALILAIVRCEGLVEDYHKILDLLDTPDNVIQLSCVKGDQHDPRGE
jgi:hypothetical protein